MPLFPPSPFLELFLTVSCVGSTSIIVVPPGAAALFACHNHSQRIPHRNLRASGIDDLALGTLSLLFEWSMV
uniref:Secreted protein n=1 Tax=Ditylenchus dipsaci TaxID=166011 RepID=A0A915CNH2_9BILA